MKMLSIVFFSTLALTSVTAFAEGTTSMGENWICTTNASSSTVDTEIAADKKMADEASSAADAYAFAASHCRDCTKITCSVK